MSTDTVEIPKHIGHIRRALLPWQTEDEALTECGHPCVDMKSIISIDEAKAVAKRAGSRPRASLFMCVTCMETCERHGRDFISVFHRHFSDWRWSRDDVKKARMTAEAEAIERLITDNAESIRAFVAGRLRIDDLAGRRKKPPPLQRTARSL